jgi:hypothetical protein
VDDATALSRIEWAMNICFFLVAIGVTGEFVGNWIAGPIRKRLETAKELEIARLNREAAALRLELEREIQKRSPRTLANDQRQF